MPENTTIKTHGGHKHFSLYVRDFIKRASQEERIAALESQVKCLLLREEELTLRLLNLARLPEVAVIIENMQPGYALILGVDGKFRLGESSHVLSPECAAAIDAIQARKDIKSRT